MTPTPTAQGPQHLRALARANEVRLARAELKRRVHAGDLSAEQVILDAPWEATTMTVADLLMSQRRWGRTRARKLLQAIPLSEAKTLATMTDRQRRAVAAALAGPSAEERSARSRLATLESSLA